MKKVFLVFVGLCLMVFVSISCTKKCTCITYDKGVEVQQVEQELAKGQTCSDLPQEYDKDTRVGVICESAE
jgi:hypothetical protein